MKNLKLFLALTLASTAFGFSTSSHAKIGEGYDRAYCNAMEELFLDALWDMDNWCPYFTSNCTTAIKQYKAAWAALEMSCHSKPVEY